MYFLRSNLRFCCLVSVMSMVKQDTIQYFYVPEGGGIGHCRGVCSCTGKRELFDIWAVSLCHLRDVVGSRLCRSMSSVAGDPSVNQAEWSSLLLTYYVLSRVKSNKV